MKIQNFFDSLNIVKRCESYRVGLWQCPHFLFVVMGMVIAISIIATHLVAQRYTEPEVTVAIVVGVTIMLFIIGHFVVSAFEKVANSSQLKSEFISILSHELRSPLSAIKWQINVLADAEKKGAGINEYQKVLGLIGEENEKMLRLINDLLDVNRIEDRTLGFTPTVFSMDSLTSEVVKEFEPYAKSSNLNLMVISPKAELSVRADEGRIKSVMSRFIDNAIRYSTSRGEIIITLENKGSKIRWSITDQGVGIPIAEAQRIFSKFFRASNILRYQTEGLGVALYISKHVVEASGGEIGFHTIEGRGSTFFFTLPKAD